MVSSQNTYSSSRSSARTRPEHRAGEGDEVAGERRQPRLVVGEVPGAVDQHQRADPGDDQRHHPLQGPHREGQVHVQRRHPAIDLGQHLAVGDRGRSGPAPSRTTPRDQRQHQERPPCRGAGRGWAPGRRRRSARRRSESRGAHSSGSGFRVEHRRRLLTEPTRTGPRTPAQTVATAHQAVAETSNGGVGRRRPHASSRAARPAWSSPCT